MKYFELLPKISYSSIYTIRNLFYKYDFVETIPNEYLYNYVINDGETLESISFDVYDEIEIQTGGHPADVGLAPGSFVNIVSKSGGNEFHGGVLGYYVNESMAKSLIPAEEAESIGLTKPTGLKEETLLRMV